ncbi:hypothetical protein Pelo_15501 [Pelomyxa schiedti]|nr:hypothetical protein Pelo_15501 [Pelomyxa schiedti]
MSQQPVTPPPTGTAPNGSKRTPHFLKPSVAVGLNAIALPPPGVPAKSHRRCTSLDISNVSLQQQQQLGAASAAASADPSSSSLSMFGDGSSPSSWMPPPPSFYAPAPSSGISTELPLDGGESSTDPSTPSDPSSSSSSAAAASGTGASSSSSSSSPLDPANSSFSPAQFWPPSPLSSSPVPPSPLATRSRSPSPSIPGGGGGNSNLNWSSPLTSPSSSPALNTSAPGSPSPNLVPTPPTSVTPPTPSQSTLSTSFRVTSPPPIGTSPEGISNREKRSSVSPSPVSVVSYSGSGFLKWTEAVMLYGDMTLFIPDSSFFDFETQPIQNSRQNLIQGELLRFYLVITLPQKVGAPTKNQMCDFYRTLRTDIVFTEHPADELSPAMPRSPLASITVSPSVVESQTYHRALHQGNCPSNSNASGNACENTNLRGSAPKSNLQEVFFSLPSGEMIMPLEIPVIVEDKYLNRRLLLSVAITSSLFNVPTDENLEDILNPQTGSREQNSLQPRFVRQPCRVLMPLKISSHKATVCTRNYLSIAMENTHPTLPLTIHDLHIHLFEDRTQSSPLKIHVNRSNLPLSISPADKYEFAVRVDALPPAVKLGADPTARMPPSLVKPHPLWGLIVWGIPCCQGLITSRHDVRINAPNFADIMVSIDYPSPVYPNAVFNLDVCVANMTHQTRNLSLVLENSKVKEDPPIIFLSQSREIGQLAKFEKAIINVQCVALRAGVHNITSIDVIDHHPTNKMRTRCYHVREPCSVVVLSHPLQAPLQRNV